MVCSRCKIVSYCGPKCQKAAWKLHKKTCVSPASAKAHDPTDPDDDISDLPDGNYNPAIVWEYKRGDNWIPFKRRLAYQMEFMLCMGGPNYMYRPGDREAAGKYETKLSRVAPPGVATHHVIFKTMEEVEIYTGARRPVRRRGPPPDMIDGFGGSDSDIDDDDDDEEY